MRGFGKDTRGLCLVVSLPLQAYSGREFTRLRRTKSSCYRRVALRPALTMLCSGTEKSDAGEPESVQHSTLIGPWHPSIYEEAKERAQSQINQMKIGLIKARLAQLRQPSLLRIQAVSPRWTYVLIFLNLACHATQHFTRLKLGYTFISLLGRVGLKLIRGEWWRVYTAAFVHTSLRHLIINLQLLFLLGSAVEALYGHSAFLSIYTVSTGLGNLASFLADTSCCRVSVGCSGGVFGLLGAMLAHLLMNRAALGERGRSTARNVACAAGAALAAGFFVRAVDAYAHLAGFAAGMGAAAALAPRLLMATEGVTVRRASWKSSMAVAVFVFGCVVTAVKALSLSAVVL